MFPQKLVQFVNSHFYLYQVDLKNLSFLNQSMDNIDIFTQQFIQFITGTLIGYILCKKLYNDCGQEPNFAPTIPFLGIVNGHQYIGPLRIHHWMWGLLGLVISTSYNMYIVAGFFFTIMFHGLLYPDCFDFAT